MAQNDAVLKAISALASTVDKIANDVNGLKAQVASIRQGGAGAGGDEEKSAAARDYEAFLTNHVEPLLPVLEAVGFKQADTYVRSAFQFVGKVIQASQNCKKPSDAELRKFVAPLADAVKAAFDKKRVTVDDRNCPHHRRVLEGLLQLNFWVMEVGPTGYIEGNLEFDFYFNKIRLTDFCKLHRAPHNDFFKRVKELSTALRDFAKQYYKMGLTWNPKGGALGSAEAGAAAAAPPAAAAAAAPVPPPISSMPKPKPSASKTSGGGGGGGGLANLHAELAKKAGDEDKRRSNLNKVTSDMKTKNRPKDERSGLVPVKKPAAAPRAPAGGAAAAKVRPAKKERRGNTWTVTGYQEGEIIVDQVNTNTGIFVDFCGKAVVRIQGKCRFVKALNCSGTTIVFDQVVGGAEMTGCDHVTFIARKLCKTLQIERSDSGNVKVVVPTEAEKAEQKARSEPWETPQVFVSKFSALNVELVKELEEENPATGEKVAVYENLKEMAVPEQHVFTFDEAGTSAINPVSHG